MADPALAARLLKASAASLLVVESHDGRVLGMEVKLARTVSDRDVRHLLWLRESLGDAVSDLVVLTTGTEAYRRTDGVAVVPLGLLGP